MHYIQKGEIIMARPIREGFDYFSLDTTVFTDDSRIRALMYRFGADGFTIYCYLLCRIYREHGYYVVYDEDLEYSIAGDTCVQIGKVRQVMIYLCRRDLLTKVTVTQPLHGVDYLTGAGIQRRFQMMAKSRKREVCVIKELWLLKREDTEPFIKVFPSVGLSGNNMSFSRKNSSFSEEEPPKEKERKENNIYIHPAGHPRTDGWFKDPEIDQAFGAYLQMRFQRGDTLTEIQIQALTDSILSLEEDTQDMIDSINRSTAGGWANFYPSRGPKKQKQKPKPAKGSGRGGFFGFEQRNYDYDDLEKRLLAIGTQEGSDGSVRSG